MKNLKFIGFIILLSTSFLFVQCTTDSPEAIVGPAGPAGQDGINGSDGKDGTDANSSCTSCHSNSHREPIESSYLYSGHAAGGAVGYAGSRSSCAQCHSNEGYIDYMETGMTNPDGYANPTAISCTTCHSKHSTFDFENDGYDYALRSFGPVTLITDETITLDYGDKSNNCASCHQPRRTGPVDDGTGMFAVTSSHWGPHHGPQSTLLEGIQGAEIVGTESYPAPGTATHRTGSSCTACHMGESEGGDDTGLHSFNPTSTACTSCHGDTAPSKVEGLEEDMATLAALLETIGIVHEGHPVEGTYTVQQAEAAWNYLLILEDSSNGVHNPNYAKALIKNSIEVLN